MTAVVQTAEVAAPKPAKPGRLGRLVMLVCVLAVSGIFLPIAAVLFCGMLPTIIAYMTDRDPLKMVPLTVGGLNFCGVLPFAIAVWQKGCSLDAAMAVLVHPITWLVMLGGAALGWVILLSVPPAVAAVIVRLTQARISGLEDRKKKMGDQWDPPLAAAPKAGTTAKTAG